ncbi:hypothetical protein BWQ96_10531 [Gracilariopsis chorda]|uniref:Retrovirus-related Pol polyprotein from transposon TNT 1-94-like beta-barrel domain-containing protein n=1 Tax=Gracilariopsis chorda TaxID=448386 RepID=A0A2V3ICF0_9FLOR|nr:hypothetical protein BWQ96_10531 [Gracilariopsis chorda]|eukprot:PXF39763.1 hypothetical protein BWQ96_10531 [Gracilariopsis chorda]
MNRRPGRDDEYMAGLLLYAHGSEVQHTSCHEEGQGLVTKYQRESGAIHKWYLDSGASEHITNSCQNFDGEVLKPHSTKISVGSGEILDIQGMGKLQCKVMENGKAIQITLGEVHYISKMASILLSVSTIRRKGFDVSVSTDENCNGISTVTKPGMNMPVFDALEL